MPTHLFINNIFKYSLVFLLTYLWSIYIFDLYYAGDQIAYSRFYNESVGFNFLETYIFQRGMVGASEPGFAFLIYATNDYLEKSTLMSLSNGLLSILILYSLRGRKGLWVLFFFFIFNYYISVLFFSAERLKFACILALIVMNMRSGYLKSLLLVTPLFFHFQYLLILPMIYVGMHKQELNKLLMTLRFQFSFLKLIFFIFGAVLLLVFSNFFLAPLIAKFMAYLGMPTIADLIRAALISVFLIAISKEKLISLLVAAYFMILIFILGTERIIILEVAYIFGTIRLTNEYLYAAFLLIGTYFFIKTIQFHSFIFECGHGFAC